ncbi:MAG: homoserine dehydrogenase [Pseudomonadota bacterium]
MVSEAKPEKAPDDVQPFRVALAGLGTVGAATVSILQETANLLAARAGSSIEIVAVSARNRNRDRGVDCSVYRWEDDPIAFADADDIDLVVEMIGGADGPAFALAKASLQNGKSLVTANKAMVAHHGGVLAALAEASGAAFRFEAAVAGGIPAIKALAEGLAANQIHRISGILNGTCNYILSTMEAEKAGFDHVLEAAQREGYAEADPTFDVEGVDTAHKLAILAAIGFGVVPDFGGVSTKGISSIASVDIEYAATLGYRIKLLGIVTRGGDGLVQSVQPCLVERGHALAQVMGVTNAVQIEADRVGTVVLEGPGAGGNATASAIVADIVDIARARQAHTPAFGVSSQALTKAMRGSEDLAMGRFYIRLIVEDRIGVVADIAGCLRDADVSIASLIQRGRDEDGGVFVVMTTHEAREAKMRVAITELAKVPSLRFPPVVIRIMEFAET